MNENLLIHAGRISANLAMLVIVAAVNVACVTPAGISESDNPRKDNPVRSMEPGEVRQLQLKGGAVLLQLGTDEEFYQRHLVSATQVNIGELDSKLAFIFARSAPSTKAVLYSARFDELYGDSAHAILRKHSDRIVVMRGGLSAWELNGFPVEGRKDANVYTPCRPVAANALRRGLSDQVNVYLIDLRQKEDFDVAHIPGAISATPSELESHKKSTDKNRTIIFYHRGGTADLVGEQFARRGFKYCGYLVGGYEAWLSSKDGMPGP